MRSRTFIVFSALAVSGLVGTAACQKDDTGYKKHIDERFDRLEGKLDTLAAEAKKGAGAAAPSRQPPQRPGTPDPKEVYSVPTDGAPYKGAEHAKVTIVDAFDFT